MKKLLSIVLIFAGMMSLTQTANAQSCNRTRFGVNITFGQPNYKPVIKRVVYTRRTYVRSVCKPTPVQYCSRPVYRQPAYTQIVYRQPVKQPTLCCDGYGWHWSPSQGKHWHYRR